MEDPKDTIDNAPPSPPLRQDTAEASIAMARRSTLTDVRLASLHLDLRKHPFAIMRDGIAVGIYFTNMCAATATLQTLNRNGSMRHTIQHLIWGTVWSASECRAFDSEIAHSSTTGGTLLPSYAEWQRVAEITAARRGKRLN